MSENTTTEYQAGGESPVSGVTHLFEDSEIYEKTVVGNGPATALCGAVSSYGPFQPTHEVEGAVCTNCERVRERRENTEDENE